MLRDLQTDPIYQYEQVPPEPVMAQDVAPPVATAFGTDLFNAPNAAAGRTVLGLGAISTENTPLAVNKGGTGANNATTARANLGIPKFNSAAVAPGVNDDTAAGYSAHSSWIDTVAQQAYVCISAAVGAAVWKQTTV